MAKTVPTTVRLLQLASIILIFHVGHSLLQERVFHLPGFHHALLLSFLQTLCVSIFALADLYFRGSWGERKTPIKYYIGISLLAVVASFATNEASLRLNYPTQVIFKSSKLLAVMFLRTAVMHQHKLTTMDIVSALTVVSGLVAFTYATHQTKLAMKGQLHSGSISTTLSPSPSIHDGHQHVEDDSPLSLIHASTSFMYGVIAVLVAVAADAGLYIVEEKYCFNTFGSSNGEIIVFLNAFAAAHAGSALTISGKLSDSLSYLNETGMLIPLVVAFSLCNFVGTTAILSVVSEFGSPSAIIVTNTRKVCTILGSYLVYPKPFTFLHAVGLMLVTGGVYAHEVARKKKHHHAIKKEEGEGGDSDGSKNAASSSVVNMIEQNKNGSPTSPTSPSNNAGSPTMLVIPPTTPA